MTGLAVAPLGPGDTADWRPLFGGYCAFYAVPDTEEKAATVWSWLMDAANPVKGFSARTADGAMVGFTHYRPYHRLVTGAVGCFLDDLFVDERARGGGVAAALIDRVVAEARTNGWGVVRWITAEDNLRARALYDRVASRTQWVTYEIRPS